LVRRSFHTSRLQKRTRRSAGSTTNSVGNLANTSLGPEKFLLMLKSALKKHNIATNVTFVRWSLDGVFLNSACLVESARNVTEAATNHYTN